MNKYTQTALRLAVVAAGLAAAGQGYAGDGSFCLDDYNTHNSFMVGGKKSWAHVLKQSSTTWNDWIWRGPEFHCTATGNFYCTYHWTQSHQQGHEWSVGLSISGGGVPILGAVLSAFNANGSFTRVDYYTESFGWDQQIGPNYWAYPVQVVVRRWQEGHFKGVNYNTGNRCLMPQSENYGHKYWWNPDGEFGYWGGNNETGEKYGMYYVFKK